MAATTYLVSATREKQGNIKVVQEGYIRTMIELYGNQIVTHLRQETRDGIVTESIILDQCDKPTVTTARAMNRALKQYRFPGEIEFHNNGILTYRDQNGIGTPLLDPIEVDKAGRVTSLGDF